MKSVWIRLASLPEAQIIFIGLMMCTFVIGGNVVSLVHCRRVGKKWSFIGNPLSDFLNFNAKEWVAFAAVVGLSITFLAAALVAGKP